MLPESQKKREKFIVEINKKRNAQILKKARQKQEGYKFNDTAAFLDKALAYAKNQHLEELESLATQFIKEQQHFDIDLLIDRTLNQTDLTSLALYFPILNCACMAEDQIDILDKLPPLLSKIIGTFSLPWAGTSILLLNTLLQKQEAATEVLVAREGILQVLAELSQKIDLAQQIQLTFRIISREIVQIFRANGNKKAIHEVLRTLLLIQNQTQKGKYTKLIVSVLKESEDDGLVLEFIENNMGSLHTLANTIKDCGPSDFQRRRQIAELIEFLYFSEDQVISTLLLSGFGEYVQVMALDVDYQIKSCAFICLQGILMVEGQPIADFLRQSNLSNLMKYCFEEFFKQDKVIDSHAQNSLIQAIISYLSSSIYDIKFPLHLFVINCRSRLDEQQLQKSVLDLLELIVSTDDGYWKMLQSHGIINKISDIAATVKLPTALKLAQQILLQYDAYKADQYMSIQ